MNGNKLKEIEKTVKRLSYVEDFHRNKPRVSGYMTVLKLPGGIDNKKEESLDREIIEEAMIAYGEKLERNLKFLVSGEE